MFVIKHKNIFFWISGILVTLSLASIAYFGLKPGIEFTGGTLVEVSYETERPDKGDVADLINASVEDARPTVQPSGESEHIIRMNFLDEDEQSAVLSAVATSGGEVMRIASIGPTIGSELKRKAAVAIAVVVLVIILFVAYAFRRVSQPVSSWKYGIVAIVALLHDTIIPAGVFAVLGTMLGYEVDVLFVMAVLAILGYSVNDTIVVFDRIRENLALNKDSKEKQKEPFSETVGRSLKQTFARSLNTSLTTLLVVIALYIFGAASTNHFALVLMVGMISGTYSSIFLASPLLVQLEKWQNKATD